MLGQGALRLRLPDLALLEAEVVPHHADDLGQRAVVALDAGRHVLRLDEGRAEEDERVGRARDVLRRDAPVVFCVFGRGGGGFATPLRGGLVDRGRGRGEEGGGGRVRVGEECGLRRYAVVVVGRGGSSECDRCDVWRKGELLRLARIGGRRRRPR